MSVEPIDEIPLSPEQQWIRAWRNAAIELPKIRAAELRAMTDEDVVEAALMLEPFESSPLRPTSGMIELQQWFVKSMLATNLGKSPSL